MLREMARVKIHRATVTEADLSYVGSITLPPALTEALDLLQGEKVDVLDVTNGARLSTYVIHGAKPGHICINGAAAHLIHPGDLIIVIAYAQMTDAEARAHSLRTAMVDAGNRIVRIETLAAQPVAGSHVS
ncbi:MAG TPA: aspartate 1-decarboxylase [Planctomycetota bacterium]|nr:aspartate 1-decarboxylase [Planctomycetota bacterium]